MATTNGDALDLTPTQRRMMKVFEDGLPHDRFELHACLEDDLGGMNNVRVHLSALRKKLRNQNKDILVEYIKRGLHYRLVQLVSLQPSDRSS